MGILCLCQWNQHHVQVSRCYLPCCGRSGPACRPRPIRVFHWPGPHHPGPGRFHTGAPSLRPSSLRLRPLLRKRSADAQLVAAVPFGSSTGLDPITQGLDASTQGYLPYAYHPYAFGHYYGKRSADADAYYAHGYGLAPYAHHAVAYGVPFGSSTGLDPITQGLDASTQGLAPYAYHGYHY